MGCDNQLFSFVRDGQHEGMAITILGPRRSLQLKNQKPLAYITIHESSQQTDRVSMKIDREVATRDRERERARRRYSQNLDVRYMSSWRNLRDKLLSAYSCNQSRCPMIRERLIRHYQSNHGGRSPDKKSSLHSTKSKNCVSIRAGPNYDQYCDKECSDCSMPDTSKNYTGSKNSKYHEGCSKPMKGNLKNDKKYSEGHSFTPFDNSTNVKSENSATKSRFDEYLDTSFTRNSANECYDNRGAINVKYTGNAGCNMDSNFERNRTDHGNNCCNVNESNASMYIRSGRYVDSSIPNYNDMNQGNNASGCCDMSATPGYGDSYSGCNTNYINTCTDSNDTAGRYVEGCTTPSNTNIITNNRNYMTGCYDNMRTSSCTDNYTTTYGSSYAGNIEAPRFPIVRAAIRRDNDCEPSTSKIYKADIPTSTPIMIDNGNICTEKIDKKVFSVDESTGGDSIMSSLMSIVKYRQNNKSKSPKAIKNSQTRRSVDNSTSYAHKPIPTSVDKSSNFKSDNKISLKNNETKPRRNSNSNPIYREVKEWVHEIPMYPGLEKEAEDKNTAVISDLVKNLYQLSGEAGHPGYDEKVRNEIDACLNKMPLWYPGAKSEISGLKRGLADNLIQRVKNLNKKNVGTNYSKRKTSKSAVTNSKKKHNTNGITDVHTSLISCNQSFSNQFTNDPRDVEVKICIIDWLRLIYSKTKSNNVLKNQIFILADFIMFRINPLLNKIISIVTCNDNTMLKLSIVNIMNDLPIVVDSSLNRGLTIQDLAEDLANRILCIQAKYQYTTSFNFSTPSKCGNRWSYHNQRETAIFREIKKCFEDARVDCNNMVIEEAGIMLNNCYKIGEPEGKRHAKNEMMNLLVTSTNLSEARAWSLAKVIVKKSQKVLDEGKAFASSQTCSQLRKQFTTSVYTSIEETNSHRNPVTSTPKKKRPEKDIPKLNPQEIQFMENVANLIRRWMDTLPKSFSATDERDFKETMIKDLAGDIMDEAKLEQLAPDPKKDEREIRKYIVCRWIFKLGAFEFQDVYEEIDNFLNKLEKIPVPIMTQPQYGNRQAMENLKFYEGSKWADNFVPKATDVLEDEISIWMHEQPSNIFNSNDKKFRHDKIHELAQVLENKLGKERSGKAVSKDINNWLNQVVRSENNHEIDKLTENLTDRVIGLPQDATLAGIVENRTKIREEHRKSKLENANSPKTYTNDDKESADQDNTMAIFISKFIEHHYDIDDPLARRAFNRLLNSHLLSLNPTTRKEVYDNFEKNEPDDRFLSRKVIKELEYVKDISDWLKNLPIDASYNTFGNGERIDFVNSLALSIREVEEDRENNPDAMDYDMYMSVMILEHLKLLPIPREYQKNSPFMVSQLVNKILAHRQNVNNTIRANESISTSGVNADNIGDFIEEFIRINGDDIAHDEVKMEAWAIRLIRELKKIIPNLSELSKGHIYNKLTNVPIPSDETAMYFNLELEYVKEITNWMKNLPLLPMSESDKDNVTEKICDLAEKMIETDRKRLANPENMQIDTDFKEYVANWISELPLDKKKEIVLPVGIEQLINRMEKLKHNDDDLPKLVNDLRKLDNNLPNLHTSETTVNQKIKIAKKSKTSILKLGNKKNKELNSNSLTDAVEKWSQALPIKAENDDATTDIKNDISRKLFQEVGQLNMNPTVNHNDILYKDKLGDEINTIFENVPQSEEFQKNKEKLKDDIVNRIVDIKNDIKEKAAGDTYKIELEKTIDTSIPNPILRTQVYDPGFEIYKHRLATAFILENFDHGSDVVKTKYETLLKKEIDKYFSHAKNRNATPLSKDQLYNELYSALFKVPIPNDAAVIDEVEKVKTRCEIDMWFEELPMREANGLSELLDWDKILSTLATRIHEIEKSESKPDFKIFKEIMKWLVNLPLEPGNENKLKDYATALQKRLKSTADQRKCVLENSKAKSKKDKAKSKSKVSSKKSKENCQLVRTCSRSPRINPADEIYDIVHTWCNELPVKANDQEHVQMLKDDITTKIIIKISELNANPEIFNDDVLYDKLLGEEIENVLSTIPITYAFSDKTTTKINELKKKVKTVKPHIVKERDGHKYKQDLHNNVDKVLDRPQDIPPETQAYIDKIRSDIVDDFIQYKYSNANDKDKRGLKSNLQDNVAKFSSLNTNDSKNEPKNNTLMKTNQLISEMSKFSPINKNILRDEVEEIGMKKEIADFFDEINVPNEDVTKVNRLKENLANKLNNIEIHGHDPENENNMKQEIIKCLKKLGKDNVNLSVLDAFITKLRNNQRIRLISQNISNDDSTDHIEHNCSCVCPSRDKNSRIKYSHPTILSSGHNMPANAENQLPSKKNCRIIDNGPVDLKKITSSRTHCGVKNYSGSGNNSNSNKNKQTIPLREARSISEGEETSSDNEDERICLCKTNHDVHYKHRPYCMMPMPMRYICERRRNLMSSLWCGMPLPLF